MQTGADSVVSFFAPGIPVVYQQQGGIIVTSTPALPSEIQVQETAPETFHILNVNREEESQEDAEQTGNANSEEPSDDQIESDKQAIYNHPLFPLMTLLFEKCEQATQTSCCPTTESFDDDIHKFVRSQEQEGKPFFSNDPELDELMVKAIQVLRIHLLEIEKVSDLCKDFCTRYITCLKSTLHSSQLLQFSGDLSDDGETTTTVIQNQRQIMGSGMQATAVMTNVNGNNVIIQGDIVQQAASVQTLGQGQVVSGGTVYQMVQTPQGLVAQPIQIQQQMIATNPQMAGASSIIHGGTPLSQIGITTQLPEMQQNMFSPTIINCNQFNMDDDDDNQKKNNKRGVLPKRATQVMKSWLFQHIAHPYPTEDEKRQIAAQTNLTLLQVNNWFINGRRRILQPMLDSTATDSSKTKKNKGISRSAQRFWPENIANLNPNSSRTDEDSDASSNEDASEVTNNVVQNVISEQQQQQQQQPQQQQQQQQPRHQPSYVIISPIDSQQATQAILPPGVTITPDGQLIQTAFSGTLTFTANPSLQVQTGTNGIISSAGGTDFSIFQLTNGAIQGVQGDVVSTTSIG